jgi:hypothetical protein
MYTPTKSNKTYGKKKRASGGLQNREHGTVCIYGK